MSNEVTVMNWFFEILAALLVLMGLSFFIYAKVKRQKLDRLPVLIILQTGFAGCAVAIMNLRDRHEGLTVALTVVQVILFAITAPMSWKRFVKHLRDEGLIENKPTK
jgi:hypothetical protein